MNFVAIMSITTESISIFQKAIGIKTIDDIIKSVINLPEDQKIVWSTLNSDIINNKKWNDIFILSWNIIQRHCFVFEFCIIQFLHMRKKMDIKVIWNPSGVVRITSMYKPVIILITMPLLLLKYKLALKKNSAGK